MFAVKTVQCLCLCSFYFCRNLPLSSPLPLVPPSLLLNPFQPPTNLSQTLFSAFPLLFLKTFHTSLNLPLLQPFSKSLHLPILHHPMTSHYSWNIQDPTQTFSLFQPLLSLPTYLSLMFFPQLSQEIIQTPVEIANVY